MLSVVQGSSGKEIDAQVRCGIFWRALMRLDSDMLRGYISALRRYRKWHQESLNQSQRYTPSASALGSFGRSICRWSDSSAGCFQVTRSRLVGRLQACGAN